MDTLWPSEKRAPWYALVFGVFLITLEWYCSPAILRQAQEIKQFYSYGVTRSLYENGVDLSKTYLPCTDVRDGSYPRPWAEEPPTFYLYAVSFAKLGFLNPAIPAFIVSLFTLAGFWLLAAALAPGDRRKTFYLWASLAGTPLFLRVFSVHMPDTMATLFVLAGALLLYQRPKLHWLAYFCFVFAVTTKAYAIFPVTFLMFWSLFQDPQGALRRLPAWLRAGLWAGAIGLAAVPFLYWVYWLWTTQLPNPYNFSSALTNRHSGAWAVLLSARFWDRILTFVGTKGLGWVLFPCALIHAWHLLRRNSLRLRAETFLLTWAASGIAFWLLVRVGHSVHDHYVLQYYIPLVVLGGLFLHSLDSRRWLGPALLGLSVAMGIANPLLWRARGLNAQPAKFCWSEEYSLTGFPKGKPGKFPFPWLGRFLDPAERTP